MHDYLTASPMLNLRMWLLFCQAPLQPSWVTIDAGPETAWKSCGIVLRLLQSLLPVSPVTAHLQPGLVVLHQNTWYFNWTLASVFSESLGLAKELPCDCGARVVWNTRPLINTKLKAKAEEGIKIMIIKNHHHHHLSCLEKPEGSVYNDFKLDCAGNTKSLNHSTPNCNWAIRFTACYKHQGWAALSHTLQRETTKDQ